MIGGKRNSDIGCKCKTQRNCGSRQPWPFQQFHRMKSHRNKRIASSITWPVSASSVSFVAVNVFVTLILWPKFDLPLKLMSPYSAGCVCRSAMCNIRLAYDLHVMVYWPVHMFGWVVCSLLTNHVLGYLFRLLIYAGAYECSQSEMKMRSILFKRGWVWLIEFDRSRMG